MSAIKHVFNTVHMIHLISAHFIWTELDWTGLGRLSSPVQSGSVQMRWNEVRTLSLSSLAVRHWTDWSSEWSRCDMCPVACCTCVLCT